MTEDTTLENRPDLETARLLLRRPQVRDIDAIVGIVGDREIAQGLARVPHPYTRSDARFFLEQVVPNEWTWAITLRGEDELIGTVGLTPDESGETAELGYWLARPFWRKGIATEASRAVLRFGFEVLRLPHINSGHFTTNPASGSVLAKLGFTKTGKTTRPSQIAGGDVRALNFVLKAEDFT